MTSNEPAVPAYTVEVELTAAKALGKLDRTVQVRILKVINALATEPRPSGATKLVGSDGMRVRVGDYRVVYVIDDSVVTVTVVRVGHRSSVYER
ncbi:MAG: type II toxin-antitoxin system RelE family toxin [Sporichthyaceae bacterium]